MKRFFVFTLFFFNSLNNFSQTQQQNFETTRFIALGASITNAVFFFPDRIINLINNTYPDETIEVYNEAVSGLAINSLKNRIDDILENYENSTTTQTFCPIHIGGNDVTQTRPYSSLSQEKIDDLNSDLDYIINAIESKGFTPILFDLSFRNYDGTTLLDEENGSKPYNDNIIIPKILERTREFAFSDGQSFMQPYVLVYNNIDYLADDNIHLNKGLDPYRNQFVNTICKYIFEGTIPDKIIKEIPENTLSTNNLFADEGVQTVIYPNPTNSSITIQTQKEGIYKYQLTDINGKTLKNGIITQQKSTIDLNNLSAALYFLRLINPDTTEVYKILKN